MKAKFYNMIRDDRHVFKLKASDQTNTDPVDIEVLTENNILTPTIRVATGRIGRSTNYVWISELKRFYYIRSWVMANGFINMELEIDVLMTYRRELMDTVVMVKRCDNYMTKNDQGNYVWKFPRSAKPNYYIRDEKMKFNAYNNVRVKNFSRGFSKNTQAFFLAIAGDVDNSEEGDS